MCCSVLQCVAVCCSVSLESRQMDAYECWSVVLEYSLMHACEYYRCYSVSLDSSHMHACVRCSVLQCVAVCCSVSLKASRMDASACYSGLQCVTRVMTDACV